MADWRTETLDRVRALIREADPDIVERLRGAGCHIEQAGRIPGRRRFYTRDPAGNRLEIITMEDEA